MKRKLLILMLCVLMLGLALTACGDKAITAITINEGLDYTYDLNETPDFSKVKATVKYNDGTFLDVTASDLTFSAIDTSTPGTKKLTITYAGFSITVDVLVEGNALPEDDDGELISISIISSSIPTTVQKGAVIDTSTLQVAAVYQIGEKTETKLISAADLTIDMVDTSTAGEKTLTVSFEGKTATLKITVEEPPHIIEISVKAGTINTTVEAGEELDLTEMEVYAIWSDGRREKLDNEDLETTLPDKDAEGDKQLVIKYTHDEFGEFETVLPISATPPSVTKIVVTPGYVNKVIIGDPYVTTGITVTAYYSNNTSELISNDQLEIVNIDTSSAGEKSLTVIYEGEIAAVAVTVLGIKSVEIDKTTVNNGVTKIALNGTLDLSAIRVLVTYTDDTSATVSGNALTVGAVDTSTTGDKDLTVSYKGVSASIKITVYQVGDIYGAELPASLAAFETNAERFKDQSAPYMVGDDNPFIFRLELQVLDENFNLVTSLTGYTSLSTVYLIENGKEELAGDTYVSVNEVDNSFDFTDAAIGKTFRIETRPRYAEGMEADCTRSMTVLVVDGYNVTNAKELNLILNSDEEMHNQASYDQMTLASNFINANFGPGYFEQYGGNKLKGFVFHNDFRITTEDIPAEYLVKYTMGGVQKVGFDDHFSVYYRRLWAEAPTFDIYGNYFTLNTSQLPTVCENGSGYNTDEYSSSEAFRFTADYRLYDTEAEYTVYDPSNFKATIRNLAMRDNDPNVNDESVSARSMLGLIAIKNNNNELNVINTNIEAYMISMVPENDQTIVNLDKVNFFNAWQGHIFVWAGNTFQKDYGNKDAAPFASNTPMQITIKDSRLAKCGGPVILTQSGDPGEVCNSLSGVDIAVEGECEIWTYVTGQESWFTAVGRAADAALIVALNQPLAGTATGYSMPAAIATTRPDMGDTQFVNFTVATLSGVCSYTVNGVEKMNNRASTITDHQSSVLAAAPLFVSSNGGAGIYVGTPENPNVPLTAPGTNGTLSIDQASKLFSGDYVTLIYGGMSIMMEYFH